MVEARHEYKTEKNKSPRMTSHPRATDLKSQGVKLNKLKSRKLIS